MVFPLEEEEELEPVFAFDLDEPVVVATTAFAVDIADTTDWMTGNLTATVAWAAETLIEVELYEAELSDESDQFDSSCDWLIELSYH